MNRKDNKDRLFLYILIALSIFLATILLNRLLAMSSAASMLDNIKIKSHEIQHIILTTTHHNKKKIQACQENEIYTATEYAIVSILTLPIANYVQSAAKLGKSVRQWRQPHELDLIMLVLPSVFSTADTLSYKLSLVNTGWKICTVPVIECACDEKKTDNNRFIEAKMYSKFNAWRLTEYKVLAIIDSDTLFVGDPMRLFHTEYKHMISKGLTIAASLDRPIHSVCSWGNMPVGSFNAGVLLLIPNQDTYSMLVASIKSVKHNIQAAEQALLNEIYGKLNLFHQLPFEYNGNLVSVVCEPSLWNEKKNNMVLIHYTVAKGWTDTWECWKWGVLDFCYLWHMVDELQQVAM